MHSSARLWRLRKAIAAVCSASTAGPPRVITGLPRPGHRLLTGRSPACREDVARDADPRRRARRRGRARRSLRAAPPRSRDRGRRGAAAGPSARCAALHLASLRGPLPEAWRLVARRPGAGRAAVARLRWPCSRARDRRLRPGRAVWLVLAVRPPRPSLAAGARSIVRGRCGWRRVPRYAGDRPQPRLQPVQLEGPEAAEDRVGGAVEVGRARGEEVALGAAGGDERGVLGVMGRVEGLDAVEPERREAVDGVEHLVGARRRPRTDGPRRRPRRPRGRARWPRPRSAWSAAGRRGRRGSDRPRAVARRSRSPRARGASCWRDDRRRPERDGDGRSRRGRGNSSSNPQARRASAMRLARAARSARSSASVSSSRGERWSSR